MRRLMSTPLLIVILVAALAGAAGLGLQASTEVRRSAPTAVPATPLPTAPRPSALPTRPPTAPSAAIATPVPPLQHFGAVGTQGHPVPALARVRHPAPVATPVHPQATHALRYTALGASDSVGVGADDPATQNWVADLGRLLPPGSSVLNLGVSGILTAGALQQELPRAVASQPDLVTVWLAVNDINARVPLATYRHQLSVVLQTLHTRTHALVFVGNVPALGLLPSYRALAGSALTALVAQWNAAIAAVATHDGATVVDLYTPSLQTLTTHPEYVSADGFHPSTLGYRDEAQRFWQVILRHHGRLPLR